MMLESHKQDNILVNAVVEKMCTLVNGNNG